MRKGQESNFDKLFIYVVICDRYSITINQAMVATVKLSSIINAGAPVLLLHINGRLTIEN
jgi:hypothetical protein